jgi:type VII secretion protein EccE
VPQLTKPQLVLIELAGAAVLGGLEFRGVWLPIGAGAAVVLVALAVVPLHRRWLYQLAVSWGGLALRRRRSARVPGLAGLLGDYRVESVPAGSRGKSVGVVRSGTTWSLPLVLALDGVLNDDAPVPIQLLAELLRVEDVPLSSVRLLTLTTPPQVPAQAPPGPLAPLVPLAARYCLLTLDTRRAAEAVASRGGSEAAVHQILRRCAVHAEQVLSTAGLSVRRLDQPAVESLFATWMGPATSPTGRRGQQTVESWTDVRVAGTWSTVFAVTGEGADLADRVSRLAAVAPTPVVATALVLQPAEFGDGVQGTMLVRLSSPDSAPREDAAKSLNLLAQAFDLTLQRMDGEQGQLLRATTPVGVGEPA